MKPRQFDLEYYRLYRPSVKTWLARKDRSNWEKTRHVVSEFSASTECHIIAAFCFYAEEFGTSPELEASIKFLLEHYHFDDIPGRPIPAT